MDSHFAVDPEKGRLECEEDSRNIHVSEEKKLSVLDKVYDRFVDSSKNEEEEAGSCYKNTNPLVSIDSNSNGLDVLKTPDKEKRKKSLSSKKPPRPPRGPSLDAADQRLIREITKLAMLRRARIERLRALKQEKAAKAASSNGNIFYMVFTVLFFLVMFCQGMSHKTASGSFQGSPISATTANDGMISVQYNGYPSANEPNGVFPGSTNLVEPKTGVDTEEVTKKAARKLLWLSRAAL